MASNIQFLRKINGGIAAPTGYANPQEGMLAISMPDAAGAGQRVVLHAYDGTAWRTMAEGIKAGNTAPAAPANGTLWMNTALTPPALQVYDGTVWRNVSSLPFTGSVAPAAGTAVTGQLWVDTTTAGSPLLKVFDGTAWDTVNAAVTTQTIDMTAQNASADLGAAYTAAGSPPITGSIVIATWNGAAYLLTGAPAAAGNAGWTALGSSTNYASGAEIIAGTVADKTIAPDQLRVAAINAPTGAGGASTNADADKFIRLNAQGEIDPGFLHVELTHFRGSVDLTAVPPVAPNAFNAGDYGLAAADTLQGAQGAGWGLGKDVKAGDMIVFDGTNYSVISATAGATNAVLRAGANALAADMTMTMAPAAAMTTRIDGGDPLKSRDRQLHDRRRHFLR